MGIMNKFRNSEIDIWRELAVFFVVLMQLSWLVPWSQWFITPANLAPTWQVAGVAFFVITITYLAARLLAFFNLNAQRSRGLLLILLVFLVFFGLNALRLPYATGDFNNILTKKLDTIGDLRYILPDEFVISVVVLVLWRSGLAFARTGVGLRGVFDQFKYGVIAFMLYGAVTTVDAVDVPIQYMLLYLFFSLLAMAAARVGMVSRYRGGALIPFDRSWLAGMAAAVFLIVILAGFSGYHVGGTFGRTLIFSAMGLVLSIFLIVFSPLAFLLEPLMMQREAAPSEIDLSLSDIPTAPLVTSTPIPQEDIARFLSNAEKFEMVLIWSLFAIAIILILRGIQNKQKVVGKKGMAIQESLGQEGFLKGIRNLIQNAFNNAQKRYSEQLIAAAKVRRMYAKFLNLFIDLDSPRPEYKTPTEFISQAGVVLPEQKEEIEMLTKAYLKVRYGELPESEKEIKDIEIAWKKINLAGKEIIKKRRSSPLGQNV